MDSLTRNEAPYAPHVYLPNYLDVTRKDDNERGMAIGLRYLSVCQLVAVYKDYDISEGMQNEIDFAKALKIRIEMRTIL